MADLTEKRVNNETIGRKSETEGLKHPKRRPQQKICRKSQLENAQKEGHEIIENNWTLNPQSGLEGKKMQIMNTLGQILRKF